MNKSSKAATQELEKDTTRNMREKLPSESENQELEFQFIDEKLKDITKQLREMKQIVFKICYHIDSRNVTMQL